MIQLKKKTIIKKELKKCNLNQFKRDQLNNVFNKPKTNKIYKVNKKY